MEVKRGQVITSRKHLSEETGLSEQQIRTSLKKLQSTNEITIQSTNKFTVITIEKYDFYQSNNIKSTSELTNQTTKEITNELTTSNNIFNNNINNKLNKNKLNKLFNYLIYKEKNFEKLNEMDRQAIVIILKRLEMYIENTNYLTEKNIFQLQLQYWTITEIYLSPYKVYLNELKRNTFLLKYLQTEKYITIDSEEKINDFISYFITCLRKGFERK